MGASFYSVAVHRGNRESIKGQITQWMEAKGFRRTDEKRLFPLNEERERGFYLFTNDEWTVVLYSNYFEYDRLSFELRRLSRPSLFMGCSDSDFWGYQLFDGFKQVGEYQSATGWMFFPPDVREQAWTLCQLVGRGEKDYYRLCKVMRGRAVFSERVLEKFCDELNMLPGGLHYQSIDGFIPGFSGIREVDGYRAEHLHFRRWGMLDDMPSLSQLPFRVESQRHEFPEGYEIPLELEAEIRRKAERLRTGLTVIGILMKPIIYLIQACFTVVGMWYRVRAFLRKKRGVEESPFGDGEFGRFMRDLTGLESNGQRVEGTRLVNDRYGCSVEMPGEGEMSSRLGVFEVLQLRFQKAHVTCVPIRASEIRKRFSTPAGKVVQDEAFVTGSGLNARLITLEFPQAQSTQRTGVWCYLQGKEMYYEFRMFGNTESDKTHAEVLKEIVGTFQLLPEVTASAPE